jgi:hypothetical protein
MLSDQTVEALLQLLNTDQTNEEARDFAAKIGECNNNIDEPEACDRFHCVFNFGIIFTRQAKLQQAQAELIQANKEKLAFEGKQDNIRKAIENYVVDSNVILNEARDNPTT